MSDREPATTSVPRRLATVPRRLVKAGAAGWRDASPGQRAVSVAVTAGFLVVVATDFLASQSDRRPSAIGLAFGAGLLLAAAPWRWRRSGYVVVWALALFFTNNITSSVDESWNSLPGSLVVIALWGLSFWMDARRKRCEEQLENEQASEPAAQPQQPSKATPGAL